MRRHPSYVTVAAFFVAGTLALLASGKEIPISKVKVGTRVMSVDQNDLSSQAAGSRVAP